RLAGARCTGDDDQRRQPHPHEPHLEPRKSPTTAALSSRAVASSSANAASPDTNSGREQPPQHEREDPAVAYVLALARRVEPQPRAELDAIGAHGHLARLRVLDTDDRKELAAREAERRRRLAVQELQWQDPHHQQVRAV